MRDNMIVALYWRRDESAIRETERSYGPYLYQIAYNILFDREDSRESVNDTYLKAWNSMPPQRPSVLAAYLGKITRQLSIDMLRKRNREKRRLSQYALSLSELEECVPAPGGTEEGLDLRLLAEAINAYLRGVSPEARNLFVNRYFFADSLKEAAACLGMSQSKAKSMLRRARLGLKAHLEKEGFDL